MDVRQATHEYRLRQWMEMIKEFRNSGKSIGAWCKEQGVSEKSFYYWQRKLREVACTELAGQESGAGNNLTLIPNGWARLAPADTNNASKASITIEVGGCLISANGETDPELLVKVCRALKSL